MARAAKERAATVDRMMVNFTPQADYVGVNATYKWPERQAAASQALPAIREGEKCCGHHF